MTPRIRKQDPFGNERAEDRLTQALQTHDGFLGAPKDDASGYTVLGARLYDPEVGRFLSADPVLDLADPVQSNGYAYAHNNPVTLSDPSGLSVALTPSERAAALAGAGLSAAQVAQAQADAGRSMMSVILAASWHVLAEFIGLNDAIACFGGDLWGCGSLIADAVPWGKLFKLPKLWGAINKAISAVQAWRTAKQAAERVLALARAAETAFQNAKRLAAERAKKAAQLKKKASEKVNTTSNRAVNQTKKTGNAPQKQAQAAANPKGASSGSNGGGKSSGGDSKPGGSDGASSRSNGGTTGTGDYMDGAHNYTAGGHSVSYTETATAVGSDSRTLRNLANVRNDGMHDVVAHGTRDGYVDLDGEITNGGQLVDAIRANPNYQEGQACRLIVCHSGVSGVGQQVADELNVPVLAPTDRVGTNPLRGPGQNPLVDNGGGWVTLRPRGR